MTLGHPRRRGCAQGAPVSALSIAWQIFIDVPKRLTLIVLAVVGFLCKVFALAIADIFQRFCFIFAIIANFPDT
jgi:hypothetical protein